MHDVFNIVQALEESNILLKGITKTIENKRKEQKGKGMLRARYGSKDLRFFFKKVMPSHPVTNFEIQKYYQNELMFNGVYFRDNVP